jgi:putative endonuclease
VRAKDALGQHGEALAARHLTDDGYVILDRNWRCRSGELDIVARDRRTLVACEVKTRRSVAFGTPFEGVSQVKLARLHRLARAWLDAHQLHGVDQLRVDIVGIVVPHDGPATIDHLRGVLS